MVRLSEQFALRKRPGRWADTILRTHAVPQRPPVSRSALGRALNRLGELAAVECAIIEISLCFGRVFALVIQSPVVFGNGPALLASSELAIDLADEVSVELRLPPDWLTEDFRLSLIEARAKLRSIELGTAPALSVSIEADPEHLLAMKLHTGTEADYMDAIFLMRKMRLRYFEEAELIHERFCPNCLMPVATRMWVRQFLEARHGRSPFSDL